MAITIAYFISTLANCGPVNVLWGTVRHLDQREFHPVIVTLSPEPARSAMDRFQSAGIEVRQLRLSRAQSFLSGGRLLFKSIADAEPDIVHCHGFRATLLAAQEPRYYPLLATLHCDLAQDYRTAYGHLLGAAMARIEYRALRKFDEVISVSDSVEGAAKGRGIKSSVIRNGIALDTYFPPSDALQRKRIRKNLGWPDDSIVVLHTGVLIARKRPLQVIAAFLSAPSSAKSLLVFAGDGPLWSLCQEASRSSRNVSFLGLRTDVPDLLRAADILISNSESEGLPLALLEGCASGLSILASDIPAHRPIQRMFPDQVILFSDDPRDVLESELLRFESKNERQVLPKEESLDAISDRTMSLSYQLRYHRLLKRRAASSIVV